MENVTNRFIGIYNYLIKENYINNASDFAKKIGISTSMMNEILKGRSNAGVKVLQNFVKKYPFINTEFLLIGSGEMIKSSNPINIKGNNNGIANTGIINGDAVVGDKHRIVNHGNILVSEGGNNHNNERRSNTEDFNNLLDSYNIDKKGEINRIEKLYERMLKDKDIFIQELRESIQDFKKQIEELREDKKFLKETLRKNQM